MIYDPEDTRYSLPKQLFWIGVASIVLALLMMIPVAHAEEVQPPKGNPYTAEQINRSLQWLGYPEHMQIGRSRVLSGGEEDLKPGESRSVTITRSRSR